MRRPPAGSAASHQTARPGAAVPDAAVGQVVEARVRQALKLVRRGESTPGQALCSVVNRLADELTDFQFSQLQCYFQAKQTSRAGPKQLLLRVLASAKAPASPAPNPAAPAAGQAAHATATGVNPPAASAAAVPGGLHDQLQLQLQQQQLPLSASCARLGALRQQQRQQALISDCQPTDCSFDTAKQQALQLAGGGKAAAAGGSSGSAPRAQPGALTPA